MKSTKLSRQVILICLIIFIAFIASGILFNQSSSNVMYSYTEDMTDVVSANTLNTIENQIDDMSNVVSVIANDNEFKTSAESENEGTKIITDHLSQAQNDYNSADFYYFSAVTNIEYSKDGGIDSLNPYDPADNWFYDLLKENKTYSVEYDKQDNSKIYVNYILKGADGSELGFVSAKIKQSLIDDILKDSKNKNAVYTCIINSNGDVIFDDGSNNFKKNLLSSSGILNKYQKNIAASKKGKAAIWLDRGGLFSKSQKFCEVKYIKDADLYLITINTNAKIFADHRTQMATVALLLIVLLAFIVFLIVTVLRNFRKLLVEIATTDALTGLANRKSFVSNYDELCKQNELDNTTIMLLDVDFFKRINDTYGHKTGDLALAEVAMKLQSMVGTDGKAGRWGGDEFIALIMLPLNEAKVKITKMIQDIADDELAAGVRLSVSVGATEINNGTNINKAVEESDEALYVSKKNGRGFLTIYNEGITPKVKYESAVLDEMPTSRIHIERTKVEKQRIEPKTNSKGKVWAKAVRELLYAVEHMIPFIAGGGILIAVAFLIDGFCFDVNSLSASMRSSFGSLTPISAASFDLGKLTFNFMLPIFAAYLGKAIAGNEAFMPGFIGGYIAANGNSGFFGAILAGMLAGHIVKLMNNFLDEMPKSLSTAAPIVFYPIITLLIMQIFMYYAIDPLATTFNNTLTSLLNGMVNGNRILLGALSGLMMATDMGGPINKAAYHLGTSSIISGNLDIMASVMVAGMVPPCGIAVSTWLFKDKFTEHERKRAPLTMFMGLAFITEGALPYMLTDIARVIPSCMAGSLAAGMLSEMFGCTLIAPHGGIFVIPVVGNPIQYLIALIIGSLVTALILGLLKKKVNDRSTG